MESAELVRADLTRSLELLVSICFLEGLGDISWLALDCEPRGASCVGSNILLDDLL